MIYQGERVINWCARCATSLSDLELEYKEEKGTLYYIKYPLKDDPKTFITVATTRPETMLGDTAVAVNPTDARWKHYVGTTVILPIQEREIPIIADDAVDAQFGTGAVKVTPAHSMADFEIGERHKLPLIKIINDKGKMTAEAGSAFEGLTIADARIKIVQVLNEAGLIEKSDPFTHNVSHCYRCDKVIEQILSKQWFVKMKELARMASDVVREGPTKKIAFTRTVLKSRILRGWIILRTGAFRAKSGGVIKSRLKGWMTCWTHGFLPRCGRLPRWAGQHRQTT